MFKVFVLYVVSLFSLAVGISVHNSLLNVIFVGASVVSVIACERLLDKEYVKYNADKKKQQSI